MLNRGVSALLAALLALSSQRVDGVTSCADCPADKTCLLENKGLELAGGARALTLQLCNFDEAKKGSYAFTFSLQKALQCDPNATLLPAVTSLTAPSGGCPAGAAPCTVTAALAKPLDWALVLKNGADVSVLQAKLGTDEVVQVAQGTGDASASAITGDASDANATVCSTTFGVKAARLSTLAACNKAVVCRGKPADTQCTVELKDLGSLFVDDVTCEGANCAGTLALAHALPCAAATDANSALLVSIGVANAANSAYASIATLAAARGATASAASGVAVGSSEVTLTTDATCMQSSLNVTVDGLEIKSFSSNTNGSITVTLASKLTAAQAGSNLDIVVSQCGVPSPKALTVPVVETGAEASVGASNSNTTAGSAVSGNVGDASPSGSQKTQKENASTGLPYGLYIAIGVGALALVGFAVECVYHRRRHSKEHGPGNGDNGAHA